MRKLSAGVLITALAIGALAVCAPTASARTTTAADPIGDASFQVNYALSRQVFAAGIGWYAGNPAGGTLIEPGKLGFGLAVVSMKDSRAVIGGTINFTRGDPSYLRTVVLSDIVFDFATAKVSARVYATDTDLGTVNIFTLTHVKKSGTSTTAFTLKLTKKAAAALNEGLNSSMFAAGMRIGSGDLYTN